jgi:RHH-type proline utilization regulon transcriptional repressor/proline dehydrogenase/delta 1-pyrroline-5-carboxylate dehydrogenase
MISNQSITKPNALREAIISAYRMDETTAVNRLIEQATLPTDALERINHTAHKLVNGTRESRKKLGGLDAFLKKYDLSSEEGIALMCLAEALLRIPDNATIDRLISDKISSAEWAEHLDKNNSLFVNAATWSLMLTGKIYAPTFNNQKTLGASLKRLMSRTGGLVIRPIVQQGMKIIGKQFVMGTQIKEALERAKKHEAVGYRYSYDMLGEAARTIEDAEIYFKSYQTAIEAIGKASQGLDPIHGPGISVKLSALHPRYEFAKHERVMNELVPRLLMLAKEAKAQNIGFTIDAEEADRLDLSLDVIEAVFSNPDLNGWEGFGLAVQSYQKRAPFVIDWLADLSKRCGRRLMVRLIKGAYWDAEIKLSQMLGLESYPVFTRKSSTDVSYIACAKKILAHPDCFYPQFGTHNAYSVAVILELMGDRKDFEFQCLHGMGAPLYDQIVNKDVACRIYAPVGSHKDLLGYLVRRLLENGANSSFINRIADETQSVENIVADPVVRTANLAHKPHPHISLPKNLYQPERKNSQGMDLSNPGVIAALKNTMDSYSGLMFESGPIIDGKLATQTTAQPVVSPSNITYVVGHVHEASIENVEAALSSASSALKTWADQSADERAACLERAADLFEKEMPKLMMLLSKEGGKHLNDCISEIRETVDFCRYYAAQAREDLMPIVLNGPTGEFNQLSLHPRGILICISPWNFPLAIFAGQVVAALVTGNAVIAKPAEQTPLIAAEAVRILHAAGIPSNVLHLLPGRGEIVGARLVADPRIAGVMFTGSTETAKLIQQTLSHREGPIVPFIAETGGLNTMIVDSSALPEQVVADVLYSAFNSAGQRCSALRVLFVQDDVAPRLLEMLKGAMAELSIGDPGLLETDIGPVIDQESLSMLQKHAAIMTQEAKLIYQVPMNIVKGHFFAPAVFELKSLDMLQREVFGPILHVIQYAAKDLNKVLEAIIKTGYGLTLGIHSRIDATIQYIQERMPVGNIYVNRNIIGAVVGVQPFGGEGLSGTGPKAGGPHYLPRLCVERSISINTTAAGGNATLVSLHEDD